MGDVPNYWAPDSTGNFKQNAAAGSQLLGVEFENATESGNYFSRVTQTGLNWGLPASLKSTSAIVQLGKGVTPLAYDEFGRISLWMKKFNSRPGSGFISVRTWGWYVPIREGDLQMIRQMAVHELE